MSHSTAALSGAGAKGDLDSEGRWVTIQHQHVHIDSKGEIEAGGHPELRKAVEAGRAAKAGGGKPDAAKPDAAKPDAAKPDAAKPAKPAPAKPAPAKPEPVPAKPEGIHAQRGPGETRPAFDPKTVPEDFWEQAEAAHAGRSEGTREALREYTLSDYRHVNGALRDCPGMQPGCLKPHEEKSGIPIGERAELIQRALESAPPHEHPVTSWRGVMCQDPAKKKAILAGLEAAHATGEPVRLDGFTSSSLNPQVASAFGGEEAILEFRSRRASFIAPAAEGHKAGSREGGEWEMLHAHGSRFKVASVHEAPFELKPPAHLSHLPSRTVTRKVYVLEDAGEPEKATAKAAKGGKATGPAGFAWDGGKHPRGDGGRFTHAGGAGPSDAAPIPPAPGGEASAPPAEPAPPAAMDLHRAYGPGEERPAFDEGRLPDSFRKRAGAWLATLSADQQGAVSEYTGEAYYKLNKAMRDCPEKLDCLDESHAWIARHLTAALEKHPPHEQPVTSWRGLNCDRQKLAAIEDGLKAAMASGEPVSFAGFTSSSIDPKIADSRAVLEFRSRNGAYVEPWSENQGEHEILFGHQSRWKVVAVHEDTPMPTKRGVADRRVYVLEDAGPAPAPAAPKAAFSGGWAEEKHPRGDGGRFAEAGGPASPAHPLDDPQVKDAATQHVIDSKRTTTAQKMALEKAVHGAATGNAVLHRVSSFDPRWAAGEALDLDPTSFTSADLPSGEAAGHIAWKSSDKALVVIEGPKRGLDVQYSRLGHVPFDTAAERETILAGRYRVKEKRMIDEPGTRPGSGWPKVPQYVLEEIPASPPKAAGFSGGGRTEDDQALIDAVVEILYAEAWRVHKGDPGTDALFASALPDPADGHDERLLAVPLAARQGVRAARRRLDGLPPGLALAAAFGRASLAAAEAEFAVANPDDWKPHVLTRGPRKGQQVWKNAKTGGYRDEPPHEPAKKKDKPQPPPKPEPPPAKPEPKPEPPAPAKPPGGGLKPSYGAVALHVEKMKAVLAQGPAASDDDLEKWKNVAASYGTQDLAYARQELGLPQQLGAAAADDPADIVRHMDAACRPKDAPPPPPPEPPAPVPEPAKPGPEPEKPAPEAPKPAGGPGLPADDPARAMLASWQAAKAAGVDPGRKLRREGGKWLHTSDATPERVNWLAKELGLPPQGGWQDDDARKLEVQAGLRDFLFHPGEAEVENVDMRRLVRDNIAGTAHNKVKGEWVDEQFAQHGYGAQHIDYIARAVGLHKDGMNEAQQRTAIRSALDAAYKKASDTDLSRKALAAAQGILAKGQGPTAKEEAELRAAMSAMSYAEAQHVIDGLGLAKPKGAGYFGLPQMAEAVMDRLRPGLKGRLEGDKETAKLVAEMAKLHAGVHKERMDKVRAMQEKMASIVKGGYATPEWGSLKAQAEALEKQAEASLEAHRQALYQLMKPATPAKFALGETKGSGAKQKDALADAFAFYAKVMTRRDGDHDAVGTINLKNTKSRAYAQKWGGGVAKVALSGRSVGTAVHELGHVIEYHHKGVEKLSHEFRKLRGLDAEPKTSFKKKFPGLGYKGGESGKKDSFDKHWGDTSNAYYVGKDYPSGHTEIISMGMEALYRDPAGFCANDPQYAGFIMGILRGTIR